MKQKRTVIVDPGMIGSSPAEKYLTSTLREINDEKTISKVMKHHNTYHFGLHKIYDGLKGDPGFCRGIMLDWLNKSKKYFLESDFPPLVISLSTNIMTAKYRVLYTNLRSDPSIDIDQD